MTWLRNRASRAAGEISTFWRRYGKFAWIGAFAPIDIYVSENKTAAIMANVADVTAALMLRKRGGFLASFVIPIAAYATGRAVGYAITGRPPVPGEGLGPKAAIAEVLVPTINKPLNPVSGYDDAYNTIEGLRHEGLAPELRREMTEFGSGWRGLRQLLRPFLGKESAARLVKEGTAREIFTKTFDVFRKELGGQIAFGEHFAFGFRTVGQEVLPRLTMPETAFRAIRGGRASPEVMRQVMHEVMEMHQSFRNVLGGDKALLKFYRTSATGRGALWSELLPLDPSKAKHALTRLGARKIWGSHAGKIPVEVDLAFSGRVSSKFFKEVVAVRRTKLEKIQTFLADEPYLESLKGVTTQEGQVAYRRALRERRPYAGYAGRGELEATLKQHEALERGGQFLSVPQKLLMRRKAAQQALHQEAIKQPFVQNANRNGSKRVRRDSRQRMW